MRTAAVMLVAATVGVADAKPAAKPAAKPVAAGKFTTPADAASTPAVRYGALAPDACYAELDARKIGYARETARGVAAPVRLTGALHGVTFAADVADKEVATTPYAIVDCRLVLALDDFAALLAKHDVVKVRHYSMYRPPPKDWPADKVGTRHDGALAIDAARFSRSDGTSLDVVKDFHGAIDDATCGSGARPHPATDAAIELRAILCEAVDARLFNVVLTPNYNKEHHNHFHLEVTAGVKWFLVH
jgi:hypothetical protein